MNRPKGNPQEANRLLENIKTWAVQAMFSDDDLMEQLVLKGGNAMALVHRVSARASVDLDFSLAQDFGEDVVKVKARIAESLAQTFRANGFEILDFKMIEKPKAVSQDMRSFWGGYGVEFKLAAAAVHAEHSADLETLRRRAINLGQGPKFLIDISRFEYVEGKQQVDFDGYVIYVYSPLMIVCEKLRAICQQMPEYGSVIRRDRAGSARARDFVDIFVLVDSLKLDLASAESQKVLTCMFDIKKVPLGLLGLIPGAYEFHRAGFAAVEATVSPSFELKDFDFYFEYTLRLVERLKPLWNM